MKKNKLLGLGLAMALVAVLATGCGKEKNLDEKIEADAGLDQEAVEMVEIEDKHGKVSLAKNPQRVVALDNRTFQTLADWGVDLKAVPKDVMPAQSPYVLDDQVLNIGNHREPNLELLASVDPDLVIVGQRFASYYDELKTILPQATIIDLDLDLNAQGKNPGDALVEGLKNSTLSLGKIFDKNQEAEALVEEFQEAIEGAKASYNPQDKMMALVVSGGDIGFSAPVTGRVWGPIYQIFQWTPALEVRDASSNHQGDDISVEAIAQSNPDWILVLDRDAAIANQDSSPAQDVIEGSAALKNTKAIQEGQLIYAPSDTYTNESIQTYLELFRNIQEALAR